MNIFLRKDTGQWRPHDKPEYEPAYRINKYGELVDDNYEPKLLNWRVRFSIWWDEHIRKPYQAYNKRASQQTSSWSLGDMMLLSSEMQQVQCQLPPSHVSVPSGPIMTINPEVPPVLPEMASAVSDFIDTALSIGQ